MKKSDIKIGGVYNAKVSDKQTQVRIDAENKNGGWDATNLATKKKVRIRSAQRLRTIAPQAKATNDGNGQAVSASTTKNAKTTKVKRLSAIDAAARVLQKAKEPMNAKTLIDAMAQQKLWSSPNGKTPSATLYAAILREIAAKGRNSRFRKVDRGHFAATGGGK